MSDPAPTRFRLDVAYDGTDFRGWSRQPGLRTVQGVLEEALATVLRRVEPLPSLVVAGRTDAGVHAARQVAHVDLDAEHLAALRSQRGSGRLSVPERLASRLRGILASTTDVVVRSVREAPPGFDARFSAAWRRYEYRIADRFEARDPLQRSRTLWHPAVLDEDAMQESALAMLGLHDFAAYCKPRPEATTIRTLQDFRWTRDRDGLLTAEVRADAFCHSMVRSLVGASVAVGEGRLPPERPAELLATDTRSSEFLVLPAKGLTLMEVAYPPDGDLAARAVETRARRAAAEPEAAGPAVVDAPQLG